MNTKKDSQLKFTTELRKIGINPFVFLPENLLHEIFKRAQKNKGPIPVTVKVNEGTEQQQTLLRYKGEWRLYINTKILPDSPKRTGELLEITIALDPGDRKLQPHPKFIAALSENREANDVFNQLQPSLQKEIIQYLSLLKTEESLYRNIERALQFLLGKGSFVGRKELPRSRRKEASSR